MSAISSSLSFSLSPRILPSSFPLLSHLLIFTFDIFARLIEEEAADSSSSFAGSNIVVKSSPLSRETPDSDVLFQSFREKSSDDPPVSSKIVTSSPGVGDAAFLSLRRLERSFRKANVSL